MDHTFLPAHSPQFCRSLLPRTAAEATTARGKGSTAAKGERRADGEVAERVGGLFQGNKNAFRSWGGGMMPPPSKVERKL